MVPTLPQELWPEMSLRGGNRLETEGQGMGSAASPGRRVARPGSESRPTGVYRWQKWEVMSSEESVGPYGYQEGRGFFFFLFERRSRCEAQDSPKLMQSNSLSLPSYGIITR